jgi:hypothetical protein
VTEPTATPTHPGVGEPADVPDPLVASAADVAPEPPTGRRPRRPGLRAAVIGVSAIAALAGGYLGHHAISTALYERAYAVLEQATADATESSADYERILHASAVVVKQSDALEAAIVNGYAKPEDVTALTADSDALVETLDTAASAELDEIADFAEPAQLADPAWARYVDAAIMIDLAEERALEAEQFEAASDPLSAAKGRVLSAMDAVFVGAHELAAHELEANAAASYRTRIEVMHLVDGDVGVSGLPSNSATDFTFLVQAVDAMRASNAVEEARKLEPDYPVRAEIEAFARSISAGVTLDFVWAHDVNGLSSDEWYSGTAEFYPTDGGWGSINLTYSVSDSWWDDPNAKAVVVHEVGHTQVVRPACEPLFQGAEFHGDHEMWATAWAIGMGYDLPGSGIEAYGRPTDAQIAVAAQCR